MDLIELSDNCRLAQGVQALRNAVMKRLGFREVSPYIGGKRKRGWLRGPEMLPRHVEHVTRYLSARTRTGGRA
jgi:hypothetical protein